MPNSTPGVVVTVLIAAALLVFAVFVIRSYVKKLNSGCCGAAGEQVKRRPVRDRDKSHYPYLVLMRVDGMVCGNCAARIENALNGLDGVWAHADVAGQTVTVRMKRFLAEDLLRNTVNCIGGYTVLSVEHLTAVG